MWTKANMKDAFLKRLKSKVGSSGHDMFGVASLYSYAWQYVGDRVLLKQFQEHKKMENLAHKLCAMATNRSRKGGGSDPPAITPWSVHDFGLAISSANIPGLLGVTN